MALGKDFTNSNNPANFEKMYRLKQVRKVEAVSEKSKEEYKKCRFF